MLEPWSKSAGFACKSVRLPQKEVLSRERMLDAVDVYDAARGERGLDPFCAELFWPGNDLVSGVLQDRQDGNAEEAGDVEQAGKGKRGRAARGPLSWSLVLDEKRLAALLRLPGASEVRPRLGLTEDDLVFLLLVDEALAAAETEEDDAGLAYSLVLDKSALGFFGDKTWETLCKFACLSLVLRQGERTLYSGQYLLSRITGTERGFELLVNPVALAGLGIPASDVLADWVALWKKLGDRPLPGVLTLMTVLFSCLFDWDGADDEPELAEEEIATMLGVENEDVRSRLAPLYAQINALPGWRVERFAEIAKDACFGEGEAIVRVERLGDSGWE